MVRMRTRSKAEEGGERQIVGGKEEAFGIRGGAQGRPLQEAHVG